MSVSSTPEGVSVSPRHIHFDVSEDLKSFWHGNNAFRTAFFNALSLQFPDGEQQFINAVRLYRDRIDDPKLKQEIRGFIGQEALHSREHKSYNEALKARGYDIEAMERDLPRETFPIPSCLETCLKRDLLKNPLSGHLSRHYCSLKKCKKSMKKQRF